MQLRKKQNGTSNNYGLRKVLWGAAAVLIPASATWADYLQPGKLKNATIPNAYSQELQRRFKASQRRTCAKARRIPPPWSTYAAATAELKLSGTYKNSTAVEHARQWSNKGWCKTPPPRSTHTNASKRGGRGSQRKIPPPWNTHADSAAKGEEAGIKLHWCGARTPMQQSKYEAKVSWCKTSTAVGHAHHCSSNEKLHRRRVSAPMHQQLAEKV